MKRFALDGSGSFKEMDGDNSLTFSQWQDAFFIFSSIRLESHPGEAQGLLRHLQVTKNLYSQGKDAVAYDRQFRLLKANHPDVCWGEFLAELVANISPPDRQRFMGDRQRFIADRQRGFRPNTRQFPKPPFGPTSTPCRYFNLEKGCNNPTCKFRHMCAVCRSPDHPRHRCRRQ